MVAELEEADVAVVVLDGLLLQAAAFLGPEDEIGVAPIGGRRSLLHAPPVDMIPGLMTQGLATVGTPEGVHLEDAEVDPELDLLAVLALETARDDLAGLVLPVLQHRGEVERHRAVNMGTTRGTVNAATSDHAGDRPRRGCPGRPRRGRR